jgi:hypothetical protein
LGTAREKKERKKANEKIIITQWKMGLTGQKIFRGWI